MLFYCNVFVWCHLLLIGSMHIFYYIDITIVHKFRFTIIDQFQMKEKNQTKYIGAILQPGKSKQTKILINIIIGIFSFHVFPFMHNFRPEQNISPPF